MGSISSLGNLISTTPAPPRKNGTPSVDVSLKSAEAKNIAPASVVTLNSMLAAGSPDLYNFEPQNAASLVWEHKPNDAASALMAFNETDQSSTGQFSGLGALLLGQLSNGDLDFSQTVQLASASSMTDKAKGVGTIAGISTGTGDNQVAFDIITSSGTKISLNLDSTEEALAVRVTSSATLSDAERSSVGRLADALQNAIDTSSADATKLNVSGLTGFDSKTLTSIDFHRQTKIANGNLQTLDVHFDNLARTLKFSGPAGAVKLNVDLSQLAGVGNSEQQVAAIASYANEFDESGKRGNGDASLVTLLKNTFGDMNANYPPATFSPAVIAWPIVLQDQDHAMLTGLADFTASITQTAVASNPARSDEMDTFSFNISQNTRMSGTRQSDRSLSQTQQSNLRASYHLPMIPDMPLKLNTNRASQSYYYDQIDDSATSSTYLRYSKGSLAEATLAKSGSQTTGIKKFEMGKLVDNSTTPVKARLVRDLVEELTPPSGTERAETSLEVFNRVQKLKTVNGLILLQGNPRGLEAAQD